MKQIYAALIAAQKEISNAKMDSKNPHFKSDYASLEAHIAAIKPALSKHELALYQSTLIDKDQLILKTTLVHLSGEAFETSTPMLLSKNDMQGLGSAMTYARRYAIAALFNTGSGTDDDANLSVKQTNSKESFVSGPIKTIIVPRETKPAIKNEAPISMTQQKELFETAAKYNIKPTVIQDQLKQKYGIEKSTDIRVWQFLEIMQEIKGA
jgi:hypothetical protein